MIVLTVTVISPHLTLLSSPLLFFFSVSQMRSTPQITKKSQQIVTSSQALNGGNELTRVEAMLQWEESRKERSNFFLSSTLVLPLSHPLSTSLSVTSSLLSLPHPLRQETRAAEIDAARRLEYTARPSVAKNTEKILRESGRLEQHDGMTVRADQSPTRSLFALPS
jgi:hypothetical protein